MHRSGGWGLRVRAALYSWNVQLLQCNQVTFSNGHGPSVAAMHAAPTIYGRVAPTLLQYS